MIVLCGFGVSAQSLFQQGLEKVLSLECPLHHGIFQILPFLNYSVTYWVDMGCKNLHS